MGNKNLKTILSRYEKKRLKNERLLDARKQEVYNLLPEIKDIESKIYFLGLDLSKIALENPSNIQESLDYYQSKIETLKELKNNLLLENGFSCDFLKMQYDCPLCKDRGFLQNSQKCSCLNQALINAAYDQSNLSQVLQRENFSTFDLSLFSTENIPDEDISPRENILNILALSEEFVRNFEDPKFKSLLFYGTTGLGKTFMSNCIAKAVLDKGYSVMYQSCFKILEILERYKFKNDVLKEDDYERIFDCDLLIIDDLGTEISNSFTVSEIFNILNTRLINSKKMIISTNLSPKEISQIYTDRVLSRIVSKFYLFKFFGDDLRWK